MVIITFSLVIKACTVGVWGNRKPTFSVCQSQKEDKAHLKTQPNTAQEVEWLLKPSFSVPDGMKEEKAEEEECEQS